MITSNRDISVSQKFTFHVMTKSSGESKSKFKWLETGCLKFFVGPTACRLQSEPSSSSSNHVVHLYSKDPMIIKNSRQLTLSLLATAAVAATQPLRAVSLDLTGALTGGTINNAFFTRTEVGSTGTGTINSFVRIQDNGTEDGYNASARPVMTDVNTSPQFTRDIQLSTVPLLTNPQTLTGQYYEFLLDINQSANRPLLSLDALDIYTRTAPLTTANTLAALTGSGAVLRYSLDAGPAGNSEILLNYNFGSGSGSGDLFAYIPASVFGTALPTDYVYLYSMFGARGGDYAANAGFEEWAVRAAPNGVGGGEIPGVPDGGATVTLLGMGLVVLAFLRRRALA